MERSAWTQRSLRRAGEKIGYFKDKALKELERRRSVFDPKPYTVTHTDSIYMQGKKLRIDSPSRCERKNCDRVDELVLATLVTHDVTVRFFVHKQCKQEFIEGMFAK